MVIDLGIDHKTHDNKSFPSAVKVLFPQQFPSLHHGLRTEAFSVEKEDAPSELTSTPPVTPVTSEGQALGKVRADTVLENS